MLAPFRVTGTDDVPSNVEIRVLHRLTAGNMDSPSLFTLSTFISYQKNITFEAQSMLLVQWMEDTDYDVSIYMYIHIMYLLMFSCSQ